MAAVVRRIGRAGTGAEECVVHTLEVLDANVGVLARRGQGGIDGTAELDGASEAADGVGGVRLGVAVGTGNDNLEVGASLAGVDCGFTRDA